MKSLRPILLLISVLVMLGGSSKPQSPKVPTRYPNELIGFKFYEHAPWKSLVPLVSTIADVRRLLGAPREASDIAQFTKAYPGDSAAVSPVFTYDIMPGWEVLIYFVKSSDCKCPKLRKSHGDRFFSVDLVPKRRLPFSKIKFPIIFKKKAVYAEVAWDEYADGTGLRYMVYATTRNLDRIIYGPSEESISRFEGE